MAKALKPGVEKQKKPPVKKTSGKRETKPEKPSATVPTPPPVTTGEETAEQPATIVPTTEVKTSISQQARDEVFVPKTEPPTFNFKAWFVNVLWTKKKVYVIGAGLLILLVLGIVFVNAFNGNKRIVKQGDKAVAKIEIDLQAKKKEQDSIELAEWREAGVKAVSKAFVQNAEEEVKQGVRNKQITDEQADQIRTKIKKYAHEIAVQINDAPIRVLDSLKATFLLARKLNKDPND